MGEGGEGDDDPRGRISNSDAVLERYGRGGEIGARFGHVGGDDGSVRSPSVMASAISSSCCGWFSARCNRAWSDMLMASTTPFLSEADGIGVAVRARRTEG